ncbi:hypothetical protein BC831DRAFT_449418 [Entophlyctis helioformis]|nr:hypothetical protein BC831DRAFT_449418 [Entophlyctis helioformis]
MAFDALDLFVLQVAAVGVTSNITQTVRLYRMPTSVYTIGMRVSCIAVPPTVALYIVSWLVIPTGNGHVVIEGLAIVCRVVAIITFFLAQLEFLKILAPHMPSISPQVVRRTQAVVGVVGLIVFAAQFGRFVVTDMRLLDNSIAILSAAAAFYDTWQQSLLLYFVLWKLKGAPFGYRVLFGTLIALSGFSLTITAVVALLFKETYSQRMLAVMLSMGYGIFSIECLMVLHRVLQGVKERRLPVHPLLPPSPPLPLPLQTSVPNHLDSQ